MKELNMRPKHLIIKEEKFIKIAKILSIGTKNPDKRQISRSTVYLEQTKQH